MGEDMVGSRDNKIEIEVDPVFRVMRVADWSQGLKLERQFWTILRFAAQSEAMRLSEFIKSVLENEDPKNKTAFLRAFALTWLSNKYKDIRGILRPANVVRNLHVAPVPSVAVTRECKLYSCNSEFMALIKQNALVSSPEETTVKDAAIGFDYPIEKIFRALNGTADLSVECEYKLVINKESFKYRARAALVPSLDIEILILYNL